MFCNSAVRTGEIRIPILEGYGFSFHCRLEPRSSRTTLRYPSITWDASALPMDSGVAQTLCISKSAVLNLINIHFLSINCLGAQGSNPTSLKKGRRVSTAETLRYPALSAMTFPSWPWTIGYDGMGKLNAAYIPTKTVATYAPPALNHRTPKFLMQNIPCVPSLYP